MQTPHLCIICAKNVTKKRERNLKIQRLTSGKETIESAVKKIFRGIKIKSRYVCRLCFYQLNIWARAHTKLLTEENKIQMQAGQCRFDDEDDNLVEVNSVNRIQLDIGRNLLEACGQLKHGFLTVGVSVIEVKTTPNSVSLSIENTDISHFVKRTVTGTCHIDLTPDAFKNLRVQNKEPTENPEYNSEENTEQASTDTQDATVSPSTWKRKKQSEHTEATEIVPNVSRLNSRRNKRREVPEAIEIVPVTQTQNPCSPDLVSPSTRKRKTQSEHTETADIVPKVSRRNKREEAPEAIEIVPVTQAENLPNLGTIATTQHATANTRNTTVNTRDTAMDAQYTTVNAQDTSQIQLIKDENGEEILWTPPGTSQVELYAFIEQIKSEEATIATGNEMQGLVIAEQEAEAVPSFGPGVIKPETDLMEHESDEAQLSAKESDHSVFQLNERGVVSQLLSDKTQNSGAVKYVTASLQQQQMIQPPEVDGSVDCEFDEENVTASVFYERLSTQHRRLKECQVCGKLMENLPRLTEHLLEHAGYNACECLKCGRILRTPEERYRHEKVHETNPSPTKSFDMSREWVSPSTRKGKNQPKHTEATNIIPNMSPLISRRDKREQAPDAIEIVPVALTKNLCSPDLLNNDMDKADANPAGLVLYREDCSLQKQNDERSGDVYIKMADKICSNDDENSSVAPHLLKTPLRISEPATLHLPKGPLPISGSIAQQLPNKPLRISKSYASHLTLKISGSSADPHLPKEPLRLPKSFASHLAPFKISDSKAPQFPKGPLQISESKSVIGHSVEPFSTSCKSENIDANTSGNNESVSCDVLIEEQSTDGTSEELNVSNKKYIFKNVDFSKPIVNNVNISQEVSPLVKVPHQVWDTKTVSNAVRVSQCKTLVPPSGTNSSNSFLNEKSISSTRISPQFLTKDNPMSCDVQQKTQFIYTSENKLPTTNHVRQGTIMIKPTENAAGETQTESIASVVTVIKLAKDDTTNKYKVPKRVVIVRPKIHVGSEKVTTPSAKWKKETSVDLTSDVGSEKITTPSTKSKKETSVDLTSDVGSKRMKTPSAKSKKETSVDLTSDNDVPNQTGSQARTRVSCPWCTYHGERWDFHNHFKTHITECAVIPGTPT